MSQVPPPPALTPRGGHYPAAADPPGGVPVDALPTVQLKPPTPQKRRGPLRWFRSLRGRLALIYAGLLLVLLVLVATVLNVAISSALYSEERGRLADQARADVALTQSTFDRLVNGEDGTCLGAEDRKSVV